MENNNGFNYLMGLTGKVLFVLGLSLNILMLLFGFWPSLIYIIIMLLGAGLISYNKNNSGTTGARIKGIFGNLRTPAIQLPDGKTVLSVGRSLVLAFLGIILTAILFYYFSQDYFKKRTTYNDCKEMTVCLEDYYKHNHIYPDKINTVIGSNPLRQGWTKDDWGHEYSYSCSNAGNAFVLISAGKDGKLHTGDDLVFKSNQ